MLILDSGGVTGLEERSRKSLALILAFRELGLWPPKVPSVAMGDLEALVIHAEDVVIERV